MVPTTQRRSVRLALTPTLLRAVAAVVHSTLDPTQHRGVRLLANLSLLLMLGLFATGVGTFLTHQPDPNWYNYVEGQGVQPFGVPSEGWAAWHGLFADAAFMLVLFGSAWFVYKISFYVVRFAVAALVIVLFGHVTGSIIRFNVVKLQGKEFQEAGEGYWQLLSGDLEYIVTARFEMTAVATQLWVIAHVLTLPVLVLGALVSLRQVGRTDPLRSSVSGAARPAD